MINMADENKAISCCFKEHADDHRVTAKQTNIDSDKLNETDGSHCCHSTVTHSLSKELSEPMGPIGPWATGKCTWDPSNGLVGCKPIVDHYSITQFSESEWAKRNSDIFSESHRTYHLSIQNENSNRSVMAHAHALVDQEQENNTKLLKQRTHDIYKWKTTLERAIKALMDEISSLEEQKLRLLQALRVLEMPESIASECIERRCRRPESELIRDRPEEELIEELALISEIRNVLKQMLKEANDQQAANRAARERLEFDWSDKKDAFEIDTLNSGLNNKSATILFKPGATRYMNEQSTVEQWEHFTKDALVHAEQTRQKSIKLRATIDAILLNAARDLRTKADNVVRAFNKRIACMDEIRIKLEQDLIDCLKRLADTELLIEKLTTGLKQLDAAMKKAQTRLDNRNHRPNVENCRDPVHISLIDEVKTIEESMLAMNISIQEAEETKNSLMNTRGLLEREIMLKKRTIAIDKERCMTLRSHFPSATALSGYV